MLALEPQNLPGRRGWSLRVKLSVSVAVAFCLILGLVTATEIFGLPFSEQVGELAQRRAEILRNLSVIADLKKERLRSWLEERRDDLRVQSDYRVVGADFEDLRLAYGRLLATGASPTLAHEALRATPAYQRLRAYLTKVRKSNM